MNACRPTSTNARRSDAGRLTPGHGQARSLGVAEGVPGRKWTTHRRSMAILELSSVSKHFGAIQALTDVSLTLHAGEVVGLMGDNGAGKSTLVKIIAGNFPPSAGTMTML